ncbi:RNA helicase [Spirochaetia bacterium]|nr:RNA helicase [Spirochaetia bacterium]
MKDIFKFHDDVIDRFALFSRSFTKIRAADIQKVVDDEYRQGRYWPPELIQINPNYQKAHTVQELVTEGALHPLCDEIFKGYALYKHQEQALAIAQRGESGTQSFVVTTGTGSGKSLAFFLPIIDHILKAKKQNAKKRTRAIIIYPMNALANSQIEELEKYVDQFDQGQYDPKSRPFTFARYTGQEGAPEREEIAANPPDILLTNYMMMELLLTRYNDTDRQIIGHCEGLEYLVLDELHTYRGRQGGDVAMLVRRVRQQLHAENLICIGTSATMTSTGESTKSDDVTEAAEVAGFATQLFGQKVSKDNVVSETLEQITDSSISLKDCLPLLPDRINRGPGKATNIEEFKKDPLAIWIELNMGINKENKKPVRAKPISLDEAAEKLASETGVPKDSARSVLKDYFLESQNIKDDKGRQVFPFKLHQFISGPGKVLCTLEPQHTRFVTLDAQRFAPKDTKALLYPVYFCRECGQEFIPVENTIGKWEPREIDSSVPKGSEDDIGFLIPIEDTLEYQGEENLPDFWFEDFHGEPRVKKDHEKYVPRLKYINIYGEENEEAGNPYYYIPGAVRFCPHCGTTHEAKGKDINRLSGLSGEGRSSATTMLTLNILNNLFEGQALQPSPNGEGSPLDTRKLLGFTDNRQDAALQSGHFNDFIFLLTIRGGLIAALEKNNGILHESDLSEAVFNSIGFNHDTYETRAEYLQNPDIYGHLKDDAQSTLQFILGYRLLRDIRKGWRYNNPSLEALSLLKIKYDRLGKYLENDESGILLPEITSLPPVKKQALFELVFDEMKKNLCIASRFLSSVDQDKYKNKSFNALKEPWAFSSDEMLSKTSHLALRMENGPTASDGPTASAGWRGKRDEIISAGPRSRIVQLIKRELFWRGTEFEKEKWKGDDYTAIIENMLKWAEKYGFVIKEALGGSMSGYCLDSRSLVWQLTANEKPEKNANNFFRELYIETAKSLNKGRHNLFDYESHEHTAQVEAREREILEARFRFGEKDMNWWKDQPEANGKALQQLPVLYCSPTMELGIDISSLNTVYMRNVPPTPANYAQRGGRAGRSGQAALVVAYCTALSPHDQWFFHHKSDMVYGKVKTPLFDLSNRELIVSHLHSIWLQTLGINLPPSIKEILDMEKEELPVRAEYKDAMSNSDALGKAVIQAKNICNDLHYFLGETAPWLTDTFIENEYNGIFDNFNKSFDRWRELYLATKRQMDSANRIAQSPASPRREREDAQRRYNDAYQQYETLLSSGGQNSDFYTYRYLASVGFLPGYNFPRLPLMAWIPGTGKYARNKDESDRRSAGAMIARPRFLGISEFGPNSLIYHEGKTYQVFKAKINTAAGQVSAGAKLATQTAKICPECGHGHFGESFLNERCELCGVPLDAKSQVANIYRIETVETRPRMRISVNDEERQRIGYELQTMFKVNKEDIIESDIVYNGEYFASLIYAPAATLWRLNYGWKRRKDKKSKGFYIDPLSGRWGKGEDSEESDDDDTGDIDKNTAQRIVPYVEDYKNILLFKPAETQTDDTVMVTLQAALKRGIEQHYEIEEVEIAAEPLPNADKRNYLLFYEASEGGAGVLNKIARESGELSQIARKSLEIMHYDTTKLIQSVDDLIDTNENCVAACYNCLLSYYNQSDHTKIDRKNSRVKEILVSLLNSEIVNKRNRKSDSEDIQYHYPINEGKWTADEYHRKEKTVVFHQHPGKEAEEYIVNHGFRLVVGEKGNE